MSDVVIDLPFAGGPDDQTDPRLLPPGSVVSAINQVYDQDGSYQPRLGYVSIGAQLSEVRKLAALGQELIGVDGQRLWTWNAEADGFSYKDSVPQPGVTHRPLFNTTSNFLSWNEAAGHGYRVVVWIDAVNSTSLVRAAVYSVETGAMVLGPVQVSTISRPTTSAQVAIIGTTCLVTWVDTTAPVVGGSKLDLTAIGSGFSAPTTLSDATAVMVNGTYQYTLCATASIFIITYETNPTGGSSHIGAFQSVSYNTSLALQNSVTNSIAAHYYQSISMASVAKDSGDLWVIVSAIGAQTDSVTGIPPVWVYRCAPATLIKSLGPLSCGAPAVATNFSKTGIDIDYSDTSVPGQCVVVFSGLDSAGLANAMFYNWLNSGGPISATAYVIETAFQASTPINDPINNTTYVYAALPTLYYAVQGTFWGTYYLVNLGQNAAVLRDLVAILAPRIVNLSLLGSSDTWNHTPRAFFADSSVIGPEGHLFETIMPIVDNHGRQGMDLFRADFTANFRWSPTSLGREHYLSGSIYDGNLLSEIGFSANPLITAVTTSGTGSFTGTWEYVVTFGRVNAQGDLEESAPSVPVQVSPTSKASFVVHVETLALSQKNRTAYGTATGTASPIYCIIYRTQALSSGDTLHYRVFNEPLPAALIVDPTSPILAFTDTTTDASLTDGTHPILYSDTGELPHNCPETFTHCCVHKNRLVGIAADQRTIWISQEYVAAVTPAFNELVTMTVDDTPEPLIGVASLYDKLLIFTETRIYVVYGDGPAISGAGNDYTTPQRIPSTSGCIDPRSLVNTPMGVMFQGIMGLMLIDNGLQVTFLGRNIVRALAPYPTCVAAHWCEDTSTVRFGFTADDQENSGATSGVLALFDVRRNRWAVHELTNQLTNLTVLPGGAPMAAAAWHPVLGYVAGYNAGSGSMSPGNSLIAREATLSDTAPWLDYGVNFVPLTITTSWVKGPDPQDGGSQKAQRYRRVRILGQFYEAHALTVTLGYDYQTPSEAHTYSSANVLAFVVGDREQVRCIPGYGKAESLQIVLATSAPSSGLVTGHGAAFTGFQVEIHQRKGGYRNIGATAKS